MDFFLFFTDGHSSIDSKKMKLDANLIFSSAPATVIGSQGEVVQNARSTMDIAKKKALQGAPDGYVVAAEHQSAGRGRTGGWESHEGQSILMSLILRTGLRSEKRMLLSIMCALAATEALNTIGVGARIKWPNDIVIPYPPEDKLNIKKIGGVLVEPFSRGDAAPAHILGIGLNINQDPNQLPSGTVPRAVSAKSELGHAVDRNKVYRHLLKNLDAWHKKICLGKAEALLVAWKNMSCLIGRQIHVRRGKMILRCKVLGLSAFGHLIVEDHSGTKHYLSDTDSHICFDLKTFLQ